MFPVGEVLTDLAERFGFLVSSRVEEQSENTRVVALPRVNPGLAAYKGITPQPRRDCFSPQN